MQRCTGCRCLPGAGTLRGVTGTVTLLTGASSGIGRSLARRLAADGHPIALVARRKALLESLVVEIEQAGGRAIAIPCDVTEPEQVKAAAREAEASLGPIERLVANAGGGDPVFPESFSAEQIQRTLALNVLGTAHCIEAVLPGMLERRSGHLVAVSSLASYRGLPSAAAYSAAKAALTNLMESLRIDLRHRGVDVTVLLPGFVRTKPGSGRSRKKPFRLELEAATARMQHSIVTRRGRDAFPAPLVALFGLARLLPAPAFDALVAGLGRKPKRPPDAGG